MVPLTTKLITPSDQKKETSVRPLQQGPRVFPVMEYKQKRTTPKLLLMKGSGNLDD